MEEAFDVQPWGTNEMIKWRNEELHDLSVEMESIADTMSTLASMVLEQGENLAVAADEVNRTEIYIQEATTSLQNSSRWQGRMRGMMLNGAVVLAATGLGCVGFLAGPIVGTISLTTGVVAAIAFVGARKVINRS